MTIGAYYQCHRRRKAVEFALFTYRMNYPSTSLVMVCDGGEDFSDLASRHGAIYHHEERLCNVAAGREGPIALTQEYFSSPDVLYAFVERLSRHLPQIKEDYFMILEDDVFVMKPTATQDLSFCVNGFNPNESLPALICKSHFGKKRMPYGACGGSILKTSFFRQVLSANNISNVRSHIDRFCLLDSKREKWASDAILSSITYAFKGDIGQYNGFCEMWYPDLGQRLKSNSIEVLHHFKTHY